MATTLIDINRQTELGNQIVRGLKQILDGRETIDRAIAVFATMKDGDGTQASHFALVASESIFDGADNTAKQAAAKASWDELNSLSSKLNTPAGQNAADVGPAITQACAKHGVI